MAMSTEPLDPPAAIASPPASLGKGYALSLSYVALTAFSQVFLNHVGAGIPVAVGLFYMALAACLVFGAVEWRHFRHNRRMVLRHWRGFLVFSVAFAVNWLFSYFSVTHAPPEFFVAVFFLTVATCACIGSRNWAKGVCCAGAIAADHVLTGVGSLVLLTSMAAGCCMYVYYLSSLRFSRQSGLGPLPVVAMRCYLLLAGAFLYLAGTGQTQQLIVPSSMWGAFAVLTLANMVLPSFLSQTCLQWIGAKTFACINSLIPVFTFGMRAAFTGEWQPGLLLVAVMATSVLNHDLLVEALERWRGPVA